MKTIALSLLTALMMVLSPVMAQAQGLKIGVVDVQYIMAEADAAKSVQKQIKTQSESFQAEVSKFERELKDMETALTKARSEKISEEEFKKKRDAFEKKLSDTRSLVQKRRQGLEKATAEAMGTLREAIVKETEKVASAGKIDLVLTKNNVVIGSKDMDLTKSVMDGVNSSLKDIKLKVETN